MENAVEALKSAFAVLMFVLALTISISSFSQANSAIDAIISMRDRENEYTYVEPSSDLTRIVGIETVVSSMYRALDQNIKIYFKDSLGNSIHLFYGTQIDVDGYLIKDSTSPTGWKEINSIDFANETPQYKEMYLDIILGGPLVIEDSVNRYLSGETKAMKQKYIDMYSEKFIVGSDYENGLYEAFKDKTFTEKFGEYYQGSGATQIRKRVITYELRD